jgi:hypothetical protein
MSVYERLKVLDITLPKLEPPVAAFVPFVRTGNLVFVSGHIAKKDGKPWAGQLGAQITTEQGKQAARGIAIELMATLQAAVGDLNRIQRSSRLGRLCRPRRLPYPPDNRPRFGSAKVSAMQRAPHITIRLDWALARSR